MPRVPRLAPVAPDERTREQQALVERVGSDKHIFTTLIRHPELFEHFARFAGRCCVTQPSRRLRARS